MIHDYVVIGGGIVGLATAMRLLELRPSASLVLIEKERGLARHQTGHNSGVIHAGLYYAPGSLKAELCRKGVAATKAFCSEHGVRFEICGKLVVATDAQELQRLDALFERSKQNRIIVEKIDGAELRRREPNVAGLAAIWSPTTGIADYAGMCEAMGAVIRERGGTIELGRAVTGIRETPGEVEVIAGDRRWTTRRLIVCGGLQADRLAATAGLKPDFRIVPFRGEYYRLPATKKDIVKALIYPVPDPALPFLGIHLTRMIDGSVTVGPNAVLGRAREGYGKLDVSLRDIADYAAFGGFWRLIGRNLGPGMTQLVNSFWKTGYLRECQKYCPSLDVSDLLPYRPGIRAMAVDRQGKMIDDFHFVETDRMLHVCNAPSPAATAAIPIGEMIADRVHAPKN